MHRIRFNVFGRRVLVTGDNGRWQAFYLGDEGKRRPARDIVIPTGIPAGQLDQYLADLCHEWATSANPVVERC